MRRLFGRSHDRTAVAELLADLDAIAASDENYAPAATSIAQRVRRDGQRAVDEVMLDVGGYLSDSMAYATTNPVIAAFVAHEQRSTGVNLSAVPSEHVRVRAAAAGPEVLVARALDRQGQAMARAEQRLKARKLTELRAWASGELRIPMHSRSIAPSHRPALNVRTPEMPAIEPAKAPKPKAARAPEVRRPRRRERRSGQ